MAKSTFESSEKYEIFKICTPGYGEPLHIGQCPGVKMTSPDNNLALCQGISEIR